MRLTDNTIQHTWHVDYDDAVALQEKLHHYVKNNAQPISKIRYIAAADVSFQKKRGELYAAAMLFSFPALDVVEYHSAVEREKFPYIPGLLSFREAPVLLPLFKKFNHKPDVILVDGQGVAHPRNFGLASHLGVLLDIPSIGCAKKKLFGEFNGVPQHKGNWVPLIHDNNEIGRVLCTRSSVKPMFISVGHKMDLDSAVDIVMKTVDRYRIPEPIRKAHIFVNQIRRENQ